VKEIGLELPPLDAALVEVTVAFTDPILAINVDPLPCGLYSIQRYPLKEVPMGEFELASGHWNGSWVLCPEPTVAL
jgi:hypothetical protein